MTRVSTFGHTQAMINGLLRNQQDLMTTQAQINTGKKAQSYAGLSREVSPLLGAKSVKTRTETYLANIQQISGRLQLNDLHLTGMHDSMESFRQSLLDGVSSGEFAAFDTVLKQTFESVVNALNARIGGKYIFGGTRSDTAPVTIDTIDDLVALSDVSDAFENSQIKPSARVDEQTTVEFGMLAEEIGKPILESLKRIAEFHQGPDGPLDGTLTDAQKTFLEGEFGKIRQVLDGITEKTVENGIKANKLDEVRDRQESANVFLETFIGNIEDVDIAEAVSRLQQNQLALEGSLSVLKRLSQLSLLDYI